MAQTSAETDREALVALYNATDGENWYNNDNWRSDAPIGDWHGVTTDANGRVTKLNLDSNHLTGNLPAELGGLISLQELYLSSNRLTGGIPPELGDIAYLRVLFLYDNQLTGNMPPELGNLVSIERLSLSSNRLTGDIPQELGRLTNLGALAL